MLSEDLLLCLPTDSGVVIPGSQKGSVEDSGPLLEAVYFIERAPGLSGVEMKELEEEECFKRLLQHGFGELGVPKIWAAQFELYSIIAEQCMAYRLEVPDALGELDEAAADLARRITSI